MRLRGRLINVLVLMAAVVFLLGCAYCVAAEKITLRLWSHYTAEVHLHFVQLLESFQKARPDVNLDVEFAPHKPYLEKVSIAIAGGTEPDVFALGNRPFPKFAHEGALAPLAYADLGYDSMDELETEWEKDVLGYYEYGGKYYGLPFEFNIYSWAINVEHFKQAGLDPETDYPVTWDDVVSVGKKLTKMEDGRIIHQALGFPFTLASSYYLLMFQPVLRQLGGSVFNESQTEALLNSEAGVKALELWKRMFDEKVSDVNLSQEHYIDAFAFEKTSMAMMGNWGPADALRKNPDFEGKFKVVPNPHVKGGKRAVCTTSWAWFVSATSKHRKEATQLIDFLTSDPSSYAFAMNIIIPRKGWKETPGGSSLPFSSVFAEDLNYGAPLLITLNYEEVADVIQRAIQRTLMEGEPAQQSLDRAKREIDKILLEQ